MKKGILIAVAAVVLLVGGTAWSRSLQADDPTMLSTNGLHWHPQVEIFAKGEKIEIPQNLGLTGTHRPVHTHEEVPIVHLEFSGITRTQDVMLGEFFKSWGKDMRSFGANLHMTVNGVDNTDYENYIMKDNDLIQLHYD